MPYNVRLSTFQLGLAAPGLLIATDRLSKPVTLSLNISPTVPGLCDAMAFRFKALRLTYRGGYLLNA